MKTIGWKKELVNIDCLLLHHDYNIKIIEIF